MGSVNLMEAMRKHNVKTVSLASQFSSHFTSKLEDFILALSKKTDEKAYQNGELFDALRINMSLS